jgi:hypothetical protein
MANRYLRTTGSDSNDGSTPALAWSTWGKALGATGIVSGDVLYVGGGTYRETVTVGMTNPTAETRIWADVDGSHCGDPGQVILSAYTTNDTTAPAAATTLNLNGRDFLTFESVAPGLGGVTLVGGDIAVSCLTAITAHSQNITLRDMTMIPGRVVSGGSCLSYTAAADEVGTWVIDRCRFIASNVNGVIIVIVTRPSAADLDVDVQIRNCFAWCATGAFVRVDAAGANTFNGGGVDLFNCTFLGNSAILQTVNANLSTSIPCTLANCLHLGGSGAPLNANVAGQIKESGPNRLFTGTARTNVAGADLDAGSVLGNAHALLLNLGQEDGSAVPRPFAAPLAGSPLLGFGTATGAPATDLGNRPRPAGGPITPAAGAHERHDVGRRGTALGADAGDYLELVGPGDHRFDVPVDSVPTTISVKTRWDASHSDANKPRMRLINGGEVGVADQTITATGTAGSAYETLTTASFTPTAKGIVSIQLESRSASAAGIAAFDSVVVST